MRWGAPARRNFDWLWAQADTLKKALCVDITNSVKGQNVAEEELKPFEGRWLSPDLEDEQLADAAAATPASRWILQGLMGVEGDLLSLAREALFVLCLIPVIVFITSAAMAFATGTSWGTMAIMVPLVIPLTVSLGGFAGFEGGLEYPKRA